MKIYYLPWERRKAKVIPGNENHLYGQVLLVSCFRKKINMVVIFT
jgi:hypothetical protein